MRSTQSGNMALCRATVAARSAFASSRSRLATLSNVPFHPGRLLLAAGLCLSLLTACGGGQYPAGPEADAAKAQGTDLHIGRTLAEEGMKKLAQNRYEDASRIFNVGLKFSPTDARLHFLNGLAYHLQYLRGNESMKELAIAGYDLALSNDPAFYHAALQMGRLQFSAKMYAEAAEAFQRAIDIQPRSGDAYVGLASAAYYAYDLPRARVAANKAASLRSADADATRTLAMVYAAMGDESMAQTATLRYASLEQDPGARTRLANRVADWRSWHEAFPPPPGMSRDQSVTTLLAQASTAASTATSASSGNATPSADNAPPKRWFDCTPPSTDIPPPAYGSGSNVDDNSPLPRLPPPCPGINTPRMAVLEVAIIRSEDNTSTALGTNFLQTLQFAFGAGQSVSDVRGTAARATTITRSRTVGIGSGPITAGTGFSVTPYALNIANSTDNRSEILARPSLVALDGMPSTFFSGRNLTMGFSGAAGSSPTVTDKPIGIGLSVTPTFIDSETLLLAVRAQRSFIEQVDLNVNFDNSLQTSRNSVSANVLLKMGQTLILSGLSEREIQRTSNGVPVLKDIPILQYLFSQKTTQDFTSSVLILITPRPPAMDQELMAKTASHIDNLSDPEKRKFRPIIEKAMKDNPRNAPGNLEGTYGHVLGSTLFLQFRSGDLNIEHWSTPSRLDGFLQQLKDILYY